MNIYNNKYTSRAINTGERETSARATYASYIACLVTSRERGEDAAEDASVLLGRHSRLAHAGSHHRRLSVSGVVGLLLSSETGGRCVLSSNGRVVRAGAVVGDEGKLVVLVEGVHETDDDRDLDDVAEAKESRRGRVDGGQDTSGHECVLSSDLVHELSVGSVHHRADVAGGDSGSSGARGVLDVAGLHGVDVVHQRVELREIDSSVAVDVEHLNHEGHSLLVNLILACSDERSLKTVLIQESSPGEVTSAEELLKHARCARVVVLLSP